MTGALPIRQVTARVLERFSESPLGVPIKVTLSQDESWSPRVQGELTAPRRLLDEIAAPGGSVSLGNWQGDTLTLELITSYARARSCAEYTAAMLQGKAPLLAALYAKPEPWHPGEPISPLSVATIKWSGNVALVTAAVGGTVAALTAALRQPGGSYDTPPTVRRIARVRRRKETPHDLDGTVTITFTGEDVRLHDFRYTGTTAYVNLNTRLRPLVADVLTKITTNMHDAHSVQLLGGADIAIIPGQEWKPGKTAWEFLHPVLESVGWQLYTGLDGRYRLEPRTEQSAPVDLDAAVDLMEFESSRDRADGFYDAAMIEYTDAPEAIPAQRWDIFAYPGAQRIALETRPGVKYNPGAAQQLVERSIHRSTPATARSTVQLELEPGHRPAWRTPWRTEHATIVALTHSYPDAETSYTLRDLTT